MCKQRHVVNLCVGYVNLCVCAYFSFFVKVLSEGFVETQPP